MSVVITVFIMRKLSRNQVSKRHSGKHFCYVKFLSQVTITVRDALCITPNLLSGFIYEQIILFCYFKES